MCLGDLLSCDELSGLRLCASNPASLSNLISSTDLQHSSRHRCFKTDNAFLVCGEYKL